MILGTKEAVQLITALLIGGAVFFTGQTIYSWKKGYDLSLSQAQTAEATSGILQDDAASSQEQTKQGAVISSARNKFNTRVQEANQNEPETADRGASLVPDSLLRAFRERRIQRNRFGCAGQGCTEELATDLASERQGVLPGASKDAK